jgi:hypothetical protein
MVYDRRMAIFREDERRLQDLDYATLVAGGLAAVSLADGPGCLDWLDQRRYRLATVDCAAGFASVCAQLSAMLRWVEQFGYAYEGSSLDALADGFGFEVPDEGGLVLHLPRLDLLWAEAPGWTSGLLSLASEHSRAQLASGRRFFALGVVDPDCRLFGASLYSVAFPARWIWRA